MLPVACAVEALLLHGRTPEQMELQLKQRSPRLLLKCWRQRRAIISLLGAGVVVLLDVGIADLKDLCTCVCARMHVGVHGGSHRLTCFLLCATLF